MKTLLVNPEYSLYAVGGNDYNPRWKNSIVDLLSAVIADVDQPAEERDRAANVLKFYAVVEQQPLPNGEINATVAGMFARSGAQCLWEWPDSFAIETVVGQDGVSRQHVVNKRQESEPLPMPTPGPVPTFEPAVPLPVLPPSDVEKQERTENCPVP